MRCFTAALLVALVGCIGNPPPVDPCDAARTLCLMQDGVFEEPCGPCVFPTPPPPPPPPPPDPCDECTDEQECVDGVCVDPTPPPPPPPAPCGFPQGIPEDKFTGHSNPGTHGQAVNRAMAKLTGCSVGSDCPLSLHPDAWMHYVCEELCKQGYSCGRHRDTPPGASDQISVKKGYFCDGIHENYQIYNYGGKKVRWSPGGRQDAWSIDCGGPPPVTQCPKPHPDLSKMKFNCHEYQGILDCTWTTVGQPEFCESIGYCCMPGTGPCGAAGCIPRGGCPIRGDGNPLRPKCEAELCSQKWKCNGEPVEGWNGNPAQSDCRGHWVTWCSVPGSTARAQGTR